MREERQYITSLNRKIIKIYFIKLLLKNYSLIIKNLFYL